MGAVSPSCDATATQVPARSACDGEVAVRVGAPWAAAKPAHAGASKTRKSPDPAIFESLPFSPRLATWLQCSWLSWIRKRSRKVSREMVAFREAHSHINETQSKR